MSRRWLLGIALSALALVLGSVVVWFAADDEPRRQAALTTSKSPVISKWLLYDGTGKFLGRVDSVRGCTTGNEVVTQVTVQGGAVEKALGSKRYAPCSFRFDLSMEAAVWTWIKDSFDPQQQQQQATTKSFLLVAASLANTPVRGIEITNASISEFGFARQTKAELAETSDKTDLGFRFELTLKPTSLTRHQPCCPQSLGSVSTKALAPATNVELEIAGLTGGKGEPVEAIGPWVAQATPASQQAAAGIDAGELDIVPGPNEAENFEKWFKDNVVQGASQEKTATLTVLASTGQQALQLNFTGAGIFKADDSGAGGREYSLYFEGLSLSFSGLPPAPTTTTPPPPPPPPATSPPPPPAAEPPPPPPPPPPAEETTTEAKSVAAPGRLQAEPGETGIVLSWAAVENAEGYVVLYAQQPGGPYEELVRTGETTHTVGRLEPGTYYFVVRAFLGDLQSENSVEVSADVA